MMQTGWNRNREFAERIQQRYGRDGMGYYGKSLVYRREKREISQVNIQKNISQVFSDSFDQRMKQYEQKYYQIITNRERQHFLRTMETIYSQPGEKKQLVYMLQKLGVMTRGQREWKESRKRLDRYEEELSVLKRQIHFQEEYLVRRGDTGDRPQFVRDVTREVIKNIKNEMRLERLRCGVN